MEESLSLCLPAEGKCYYYFASLCMKYALLIVFVVTLSSSRVWAQSARHVVRQNVIGNEVKMRGERTMRKIDSLFAMSHNVEPVRTDSMTNPYYVSLMGAPSLYPSTLHRLFALKNNDSLLHKKGLLSAEVGALLEFSDLYLVDACIAYPAHVLPYENSKQSSSSDMLLPEKRNEMTLSQRFSTSNPKESTVRPPAQLEGDDDLGIVVRRPNFWSLKYNLSLQFTQNYVSDNWYKGGESHNALLASTVIEANYNNQQKITFDNKLEMKLGFQTSQNDEEHKYKTNSDLIRLTNKLGLRAVKNWYYTVMLQSWTQFCKGYKANDPRVYSDFMSPFESLLSIGMDYQQTTKNKRFTISATLSPLALKFKYVGRSSLITHYGLDEGKHTKWEYGSNVTINYKWNIMNNVSWSGRLYYFTDYTKTQIEWENTFNLTINRYLSARLFLYPRFDDSRNKGMDKSHFEFNELLSMGFNMNF